MGYGRKPVWLLVSLIYMTYISIKLVPPRAMDPVLERIFHTLALMALSRYSARPGYVLGTWIADVPCPRQARFLGLLPTISTIAELHQ